MSDTTISSFFGDDHDRLDAIFVEFQQRKQDQPAEAAETFARFQHGLVQHIDWEEQILFPAFEEKANMQHGGPTFVMRHEHQLIQQTMTEIRECLQQQAATDSLEQVLLELLSSHNDKEEQILYPMIDRLMDAAGRQQMLTAVAEMTASTAS